MMGTAPRARIAICEGDIAADPAPFRIPPLLAGVEGEDAVRAAFRAGLAAAREQGATVVAVPALGAGPLPLQRCAEILLEEARRAVEQPGRIEEIRFVVPGEPAFRVFESVQDAVRIAEQMERLARGH
jgi:O-acetyl-ADP-ribose deacetylase (regulator of RNase III)